MCGQKTAMRRRKQIAKGNRHIAPMLRSRIKTSVSTAATKGKGK